MRVIFILYNPILRLSFRALIRVVTDKLYPPRDGTFAKKWGGEGGKPRSPMI